MNFELRVNELDEKMSNKLFLVKDLSETIRYFFTDKFYGKDLKSIIIIIILIKTQKGYEEWYKVRKPKFIEHKIIKNIPTGNILEIEKEFTIETRIDFDDYDNLLIASDKEGKHIIAQEILKSLSNLDALPKKVKDFDKKRFKADMEIFFKEQNLI